MQPFLLCLFFLDKEHLLQIAARSSDKLKTTKKENICNKSNAMNVCFLFVCLTFLFAPHNYFVSRTGGSSASELFCVHTAVASANFLCRLYNTLKIIARSDSR